jgi:GTP cyclohydrolase I
VGLSKLARVAIEYAARATVQERVTAQIADAIEGGLDTVGVAVLMLSDHSCMSLRGARAHGAATITEVYRGVYTDPAVQAGFVRAAGILP